MRAKNEENLIKYFTDFVSPYVISKDFFYCHYVDEYLCCYVSGI